MTTPAISIFEPTTKLLIQLAASVLDKQLETITTHHASNQKAVDAIRAARAAISGAVQQLVELS